MNRSNSNPIKIGIIGYGNWSAKIHVPYLLSRQDAEVVGIYDIAKERLLNTNIKSSNNFTDPNLFYNSNKLDAVLISTPHYLHYSQIKSALEQNCHVLVDKPLACNFREASQLVELAANRRKLLVVASQRRYDDGYKLVQKIINNKEIGNLQAIDGLFAQQLFDDFEGSWRSKSEENCGGILADTGYHSIDTLLWTSGATPISIFANLSQQGLAAEKTASVSIKFKDAILASIIIFRGAPKNTGIEELLFYGDNGSIVYRREKSTTNKTCELTQTSLDGNVIFQKTITPSIGWEPTANFLNAITFNEEIISSGKSNLLTVHTIETAYKSALTEKAEFLNNIVNE
jgi:predicted dehydrogenase